MIFVRKPRGAGVVLLVLALVGTPSAWSQYSPYGSATGAGAGQRRTSTGHVFPTWERDVDADEVDELPEAPQGHHVPALSIDLGEVATGVCVLSDGTLVAGLASGKVRSFDVDAKPSGEVDVGHPLVFPPLAVGDRALVAWSDGAALVHLSDAVWSGAAGARLVTTPSVAGDVVSMAREGGVLELRHAKDGSLRWSARVGDDVSAGPLFLEGVVVVGTVKGALVGLDAADGTVLWTTPLGDRLDGLSASAGSVFVSGHGATSRTRNDVGPFVGRVALRGDGRSPPQPKWRLRVGASCPLPPLLLDDRVAFACHDDWLRVVDRDKGNSVWRTDLPGRVLNAPVNVGDRLDFVLALSGVAVAIARDNGGVMGWMALEDQDETFVGPAVARGGLTIAATSLGRVVGLKWEPQAAPKEGAVARRKPRPGREGEGGRRVAPPLGSYSP